MWCVIKRHAIAMSTTVIGPFKSLKAAREYREKHWNADDLWLLTVKVIEEPED